MATKLIVGLNDLNTVNPKLAKEWDYAQNDELTPQMVTAGSSKKVFWKAECGHQWAATIASRNSGVGCPICAREKNKNKIHLSRLNKAGSLKEKNPEVASEWHPTKNGDLTPDDVTTGSHAKVWWQCNEGHSWEAVIKQRSNGSGCPICYKEKHSVKKQSRKSVPIRILGVERPDLLTEWDYEKNEGIDPFQIAFGSHTKVFWKCQKGHSWQASPNHRTSKERNCPYCAINPQVLPGENDLGTCFPMLAKEWNYEKNGELKPSEVTAKSSKVVWWKCPKGHEWKTSVQHRTGGSNCPKCASGAQTSFPEQAIYYYVKKYYPDALNGYTEIFNNHGMELDIYVPSEQLGIEYDGIAFHRSDTQIKREYAKYGVCKEHNIRLIRIRENCENVLTDSSDELIFVKDDLNKAIKELIKDLPGLKDIDVDRDAAKIDSMYRNSLQAESFGKIYPEIAAEWNYEKNEQLKPDMFMPRSNKLVWWKCKFGHEWQAKIDARVRGTGCPYCSNNRILPGFNDLATRRPDLIIEWDHEKNLDLDPSKLSVGSGKKAWWKCSQGHSWQAEISSRNKGAGCPFCAGNRR